MKTTIFAVCDSKGNFDYLLNLSEEEVICIIPADKDQEFDRVDFVTQGKEDWVYFLDSITINLKNT